MWRWLAQYDWHAGALHRRSTQHWIADLGMLYCAGCSHKGDCQWRSRQVEMQQRPVDVWQVWEPAGAGAGVLPKPAQPCLHALRCWADALASAPTACCPLQVPRQLQEVSQLLASARGFRNVAGDAEAAAASRALDRALHTMRRCGALLRSTLPAQEQARLAADLLQGVSQELLGQLACCYLCVGVVDWCMQQTQILWSMARCRPCSICRLGI